MIRACIASPIVANTQIRSASPAARLIRRRPLSLPDAELLGIHVPLAWVEGLAHREVDDHALAQIHDERSAAWHVQRLVQLFEHGGVDGSRWYDDGGVLALMHCAAFGERRPLPAVCGLQGRCDDPKHRFSGTRPRIFGRSGDR